MCVRGVRARPCAGYWDKFSRLLSGPERSAARSVGQMGFNSVRKSPRGGGGHSAAVQRKVTEGERAARPGARRWTGSGCGGAVEHPRLGERARLGAAALCYRARPAGGSRGGVGEAAAATAAFFCLFCQRNIKYSFATCRPPSQKGDLALPLTCQPGRRSVWLFALVLQLFHG